MSTVAVIQARIQSTRLPAKVLREIAGKPMLEWVVERTRSALEVDEVVVAIPDSPSDELLLDFVKSKGWHFVSGSEHDVLSRYVLAAEKMDASRVVRITSDCPLIDPGLIDDVLNCQRNNDSDYACNFYPRRLFPRGLDCEVITRSALHRLDRLAKMDRHREHVTLLVYETAATGQFSIASTVSPIDGSGLRWTVDTPEDLELVRVIYEHFGSAEFGWRDVLAAYQDHESWKRINHETLQKVA